MAKLIVASSIKEDEKIWRYLPLEALIYLLDKKKLYFTLLSAYESSDPREGYPPMVAITAFATVFAGGYLDSNQIEQIKSNLSHLPEEQLKELVKTLEEKLAEAKKKHKKVLVENFNSIIKKSAVNCWHKSNVESEAMWRIYSSNGVAIVSSINSIKASLEKNTQDIYIHSGSVKYLDYDDEHLMPRDCVSDGHVIPLIKSKHYEHEKEFRFFIAAKMSATHEIVDPETQIDIEPKSLIEKVVISPYAKEPFVSSVIAICKLYQIPLEKVSKSNLLESYNNKMQEILDGLLN